MSFNSGVALELLGSYAYTLYPSGHIMGDLGLLLSFGGSIKALDKLALSIEEMEAYAKEVKSPLIGLTNINKKVSYVVYKMESPRPSDSRALGNRVV